MSFEDRSGLGLRERKKRETRAALSAAALRLAIDRGLSNVLVEDIAAAVNVSPRTFNNYFHSKEDAILSPALTRVGQLRGALADRPVDEPLWDAVAGALVQGHPRGRNLCVWRDQSRLIKVTASLSAARARIFASIEGPLAAEIGRRTGTDVDRDLYPRLAAGVIATGARVAIDHWVESTLRHPVEELLERALREIARGLPPPGFTGD
ncbi:MAG: TetR family transcriptional regulator [Frankia sp.]